ncbi:glycosyltransferase, partial [endosymbiont of Ridgeia piscesae]
MKKQLRRIVATVVLFLVYWASVLFSKLIPRRGGGGWKRSGRILVIGTFHNPNWFHAHLTPLTKSGVDEVVLITDEMVAPMDGVVYECPPQLMQKLLSRAGAKFVWSIVCGFRHRPDLYMGYHIFPSAIIALIAARLFNRPAGFQVTSGPLELEGGGWNAENVVLTALGGPSKSIEKAVHAATREFDLVIVRGRKAEAYVRELGYQRQMAIITGSMAAPADSVGFDEREIDLISVGRLCEYKRPDRFVRVVAKVAQNHPEMRVAMVGDGPDRAELEALADELGVRERIDFMGKRSDVPDLLAKARVFGLTSRWEGLSIAMIEAMMSGVVPVVGDVGDLADLADSENNGFVVDPDDIDGYAKHIDALLSDAEMWQRFSSNARQASIDYSSVDAVAGKWQREFETLM